MPSDEWWDKFLSWLKRIARVIGLKLAKEQRRNERTDKRAKNGRLRDRFNRRR